MIKPFPLVCSPLLLVIWQTSTWGCPKAWGSAGCWAAAPKSVEEEMGTLLCSAAFSQCWQTDAI